MRTVIDAQLRAEASHFGFRFRCEECAHFAPEQRRCANGYPNQAHLAIDLTLQEGLEFCKEFELV